MGDGILWSAGGKGITTDKAGDIDFDLKTGVNTIPVDIVNSVTGECHGIQISLAHEGELGLMAVLFINLGGENGDIPQACTITMKAGGGLNLSVPTQLQRMAPYRLPLPMHRIT